MRILFVGNSYTLYHDVPGIVGRLASESGKTLDIGRSLEGGANWGRQLDDLAVAERIAEGWDVVVLQNKSTEPLLAAKEFERRGKALGELCQATRARIVLYQTWSWAPDHSAYRDRWSKQGNHSWDKCVEDAYARLATELDADVAPVGTAWARARIALPHLDLYDADRHHASAVGAYLAALVLSGNIFRVATVGTRYCPSGLDEKDCEALRAIADDV